ncbi:MAG: hypothetical protein Q8K99_04875 [Actinomycetota bacterium]|nr:hypothetical protein [Actinomycetota bacterium]
MSERVAWGLADYLGTLGVAVPVLALAAAAGLIVARKRRVLFAWLVAPATAAALLIGYGVLMEGTPIRESLFSAALGPIEWLLVWMPLGAMLIYLAVAGTKVRSAALVGIGLAVLIIDVGLLTILIAALSSSAT